MQKCCFIFVILQIDTLVKHANSKIDADYMKIVHSRYNGSSVTDVAVEMDKVKILQSILSKHLPPERYNGLINLFYLFKNPNATSTEISSALVIRAKLKYLHIDYFTNPFTKNAYFIIPLIPLTKRISLIKFIRYNFRTICTELIAMRQKHYFSSSLTCRIQV